MTVARWYLFTGLWMAIVTLSSGAALATGPGAGGGGGGDRPDVTRSADTAKTKDQKHRETLRITGLPVFVPPIVQTVVASSPALSVGEGQVVLSVRF